MTEAIGEESEIAKSSIGDHLAVQNFQSEKYIWREILGVRVGDRKSHRGDRMGGGDPPKVSRGLESGKDEVLLLVHPIDQVANTELLQADDDASGIKRSAMRPMIIKEEKRGFT